MTALQLGGRAAFSTVDMPGMTAATLFCQGCSWRCRYCHNSHLQTARTASPLAWDEVLRWLEPRRGFLDAVVFSGGEPLLQAGLADAMRAVKAMGFAIGLHTGGCLPGRLGQVLPLVDWIGLDLKAPRHAYERITGVPGSGTAAWAALEQVLASSVAHEIRTTYHPDLLSEDDLRGLAGALAGSGAVTWVLQSFRPQGCADPTLQADPGRTATAALLEDLQAIFLESGIRPGRPQPGPPTGRPRLQAEPRVRRRTFLAR